MSKNCEDFSADVNEENIEGHRIREVTVCELGRLVLLEYTKKEFWVGAVEKMGGIEGLLFGAIRKIL